MEANTSVTKMHDVSMVCVCVRKDSMVTASKRVKVSLASAGKKIPNAIKRIIFIFPNLYAYD